MAEYLHDPETGVTVLNDSDVDSVGTFRALAEQHPEVAALVRWSSQVQSRRGLLFERDKYVTPTSVFEQFRVAREAVEADDVVGGVLESTEGLAFSKMSVEAEDEDEQDVWNQLAAELNLDARLREMWHEMFSVSQFYCALWWGRRTYRVRGRSDRGARRRREFRDLEVPVGITVLDPLKVVPVGGLLFGQEGLAWVADRDEAAASTPCSRAGRPTSR